MLRLEAERRKRGWSQAEVARRTGLHPSTISHLEAGDIRPWPSYISRLSRLFGVPRNELTHAVSHEESRGMPLGEGIRRDDEQRSVRQP